MNEKVDQIGVLLNQLQSPDFYVREEAVKQLSAIDRDEAVAGLVMALEDPDLGIRELAAGCILSIKGQTAAQLLIAFLASEDINTRNLASEILVQFGHEAVLPLVSRIDCDDHDIRKFIVDILGLIKDENSVDAVVGKLSDENANVVCSAAEALGEIGSSRAIPALIETFINNEDVRLQALEALGKIGDPSALEPLRQFFETDDPMIKFAVIESIGAIGDSRSLPIITPYLEDDDITIAETALTAVVSIILKNPDKTFIPMKLERFVPFIIRAIRP